LSGGRAVKLFLASDHAGVKLRIRLLERLRRQGHEAVDLGPQTEAPTDYPDWSARVGRAVRAERGALGILVCGSGIGVNVAANKLRGIRAAAPCSIEAARLARAHNDVNVLCLGARVCEPEQAEAMIAAWLSATPEGDRHARRRAKVAALESAEAIAAVVEAEGARLEARKIIPRLWASDRRWLRAPEEMQQRRDSGELCDALFDARQAGFRHAVLLGGSLAAEALGRTFGAAAGVELLVLEGNDPAAIAAVERTVDLGRALFLVTAQAGDLESYFWKALVTLRGEQAGSQFVALGDGGEQATERGYRTVLRNPTGLGPLAPLAYQALFPATLLGIYVNTLLGRARRMAGACREPAVAANPGAQLGAALAATARLGRDKLTLVGAPELASLMPWIGALVASATGIVPIVDEPPGPAEVYGPDRLFVLFKLAGGPPALGDDAVVDLRVAGHPVIELVLTDRYDLGGEFFRWQVAAAVAGTERLVTDDLAARVAALLRTPGRAPAVTSGDRAVAAHLDLLECGDHLALGAFFARTERRHQLLGRLRAAIRARTRAASTLAYGPRPGGSTTNGLVYLQLAGGDRSEDRPIPDRAYGFRAVVEAQALAELQSLESLGRPVLRIELGDDVERGLERLIDTVAGEPARPA
jgi:RpiB/LacA/LacB family sugar-phosphate isomerase